MTINRRIAILLSGRGSNFVAISDAIKRGDLRAEMACVISDKKEAAGLARAREEGYEALFIDPKGLAREAYDRVILAELKQRDVALVALAGFMRLLSPVFVQEYRHRILNIHPALLPAFPGLDAQRQALTYGVKYSGCTVHLVDEGVDTGPIVMQAAVPVMDNDTAESLAARILVEEHKTYWQAIGLILENRIRIEGRRVLLLKADG
jgi:phosphoribosylglycinamide formyltransferase-1